MAITLVKAPSQLHPAKNKVEFTLNTNNQYIVPPNDANRARVSFSIVANPVSAGNIKFFIGNPLSGIQREIVFTFHTSPNESGTQLPNNNAADPSAVYGARVIEYLLKNYYIGSAYTAEIIYVSLTEVEIELTANEEGIENSISFQENLASNEVVGTGSANGSNTTKRPNFRIFFDVFKEQTWGQFDERPVYSAEGVPDAAGNCSFDIKRIITAITSYTIPPFATGTGIESCPGVVRYFIKALESWGDIPVPQGYMRTPSTANEYLIALHGAFAYASYPFAGAFANYISNSLPKFCTAMPNGKITVHRSQKQFLTCYTKAITYSSGVPQPGTYRLQGILYYTDGTNSGAFANWKTFTGVVGDCFKTYRVGYNDLAIDTLKASGKTVSKYTVRLFNGTNAISENFTFNVEPDDTRYPRYFMFMNSFGFPESVYFYGDQVRNIGFTTRNIQRHDIAIDETGKIFDGEFDETDAEWRRTFEISTGNKDRAHQLYFLDFINSPARYLQDVDKFVKINLSSSTIELDDDERTTFALRLAYSDSFLERGIA
jgi:hypothetical protein